MISKFKWFLIVIILLLSVRPALTQPIPVNGYAVQHFTDENGLPQNSINDLLFDKNGYLWLASQVGLVRYDGSSFQLYYPNDKAVMESNIALLGKDYKGSIYFQTTDHNLYCYTGNNSGSLAPLNTPVSRHPLLLNAQKRLFDFTAFLQHASTPAATREHQAIFEDLFVHNENFYVTDAGAIYLIYRDSIYYYNGGELHRLSRSASPDSRFLIAGNRFFVLSRDTVLTVYEGERNIGSGFPIETDPRQGFPPGIARDQYRLFSCGRVAHLLAGHLLYRLFPEANGHLRAVFQVDLGFVPNISAVEYNAGLDLLLVATNTEGFYFLRRNRFGVTSWPADFRDKLAHHLFGPMALEDGRRIVTDKFLFTPAGDFTWVKNHGPVWQRCLYIDRKDQIWAAFDSLPKRLTASMDLTAAYPALDGNITDYTEDSAGHLYCLTERSVYRFDNDHFRRLDAAEPSPGDPRSNEVIRYVGPHRLWIGHAGGLIEYDPDGNTAHVLPELSGAHVRAIHCCKDGSILIGTYGQGYFYYFQNHFFRMPLDKNGFLMTAHCFLEDGKGNVWIPCNKGLFKTSKTDMDAWVRGESNQLYYYYYGRQDGLLTNEFNGGFNSSGIITPQGFVALLSMKGIVCFYTDSLQTDFPSGAIDMTELDVDGVPLRQTDTLRLAANYNNLLVKIGSPYLGNRNNLYLEYELEGFSEEWKEMPADGTLNLSRLAPGNYTLRVRKVNGFGKNNYAYRQWSIIVPPLFYRTTWFLAGVAVIMLVLLGLLIQLRLTLVEKQKEIRVKAEKLKATVVRLEETVTKLQHSEQALLRTNRQREKLISLVIHDLRSPLRFLTMLAGDLHDNQDSFTPRELKDRAFWVKKGAQDVYNFSEDFLLWVTSQKDNFKISKKLFYVRPLLQEIHDFYLDQASQKGNSISYEADEDLQVWSDPHLLITIIRNLTDNANKYTEQGVIRISARRDNDDLLITVADTGKGMNRQQVAAFLGQDSLDNVKSGSQLGHKFIFDLTQRLNGALSVESGENTGTRVSLRVPMEPAHIPQGEWSD
jgi:signal transduction histidine kinase